MSETKTVAVTAQLADIAQYCQAHQLFYEQYTRPRHTHYLALDPEAKQAHVVAYGQSNVFLTCLEQVTAFGVGYVLSEQGDLFVYGFDHSHYDQKVQLELSVYCDSVPADLSAPMTLQLPEPTYIDEEVVLLWGNRNFGHWIFQYLTRLAVLDYLPELFGKKIVITDDTPDRFVQYLLMLGFQESQLIRVPRCVKFRRVWIPSIVCYRGHYRDQKIYVWPQAMHFMRHRLLGKYAYVNPPTNEPPVRLYLSRENSSWRKVLDESELIEKLAMQGFQSVCMEDLTAEAQLALIAKAEMIIIPAGAGGIITMLAASNATILELNSDNIDGVWTRIWCHFLGQHFVRIDGERVPITEQREHSTQVAHSDYDLRFDFSVILEMVHSLLALRENAAVNFEMELGDVQY